MRKEYVVIKKDGRKEAYDPLKIINAVNKSALRVLYRELSELETDKFLGFVEKQLDAQEKTQMPMGGTVI